MHANPFADAREGQLGPQVLQHAKDLRWSSVRSLILLSTKCQGDFDLIVSSTAGVRHSANLSASVLGNPDLLELVAEYLLRTDIIVCDKSVEKGPDEVKRRIEAALAANEKNARK
jgi:hypothetical protein